MLGAGYKEHKGGRRAASQGPNRAHLLPPHGQTLGLQGGNERGDTITIGTTVADEEIGHEELAKLNSRCNLTSIASIALCHGIAMYAHKSCIAFGVHGGINYENAEEVSGAVS
jgi:hypothetical protein